jgi:hypothetical protein
MGLDPGDLFDTELEAANDAMRYIATHHQWIDFEFAATIYQLFTGPAGCKYSYTEPRTDFSPVSVNPSTDVPPGSDITADYHNHTPAPEGPILLPDGWARIPKSSESQFSGGPVPMRRGDINAYEENGTTGYMGSPNGKLHVYYPKNRAPKTECGCQDSLK